ncbi:hypothetical protein B296_00056391 [Ensete ventricosum]|uniref:Uncharacterized protein n=1 Tax=Ensete ventricosum TaxID=4639 RepID=A0A426XVC3_ENSVE|nr:hypothetical protein B296_00056391 [Ensete ventricosum]
MCMLKPIAELRPLGVVLKLYAGATAGDCGRKLEMAASSKGRRGVESATATTSVVVGKATEAATAVKESATTWVVGGRWGLEGR